MRGEPGEGAVILLNGEEVSLQASLKQNDRIIIRDSTVGAPAKMVVEALPEYTGSITFEVNDRQVVCPKFAQINGKLESGYYEIKEHDKIEFLNYYTVEQVFRFLDIDAETMKVYVNNRLASLEDKVYENFSFRFEPLTGTYEDLVESTEA